MNTQFFTWTPPFFCSTLWRFSGSVPAPTTNDFEVWFFLFYISLCLFWKFPLNSMTENTGSALINVLLIRMAHNNSDKMKVRRVGGGIKRRNSRGLLIEWRKWILNPTATPLIVIYMWHAHYWLVPDLYMKYIELEI